MSLNLQATLAHTVLLTAFGVGWLTGVASTGGVAPEPDTNKPGICERLAVTLVGQKAVRVEKTIKAPKRIREVKPRYPPWPPGATGRGMWTGEILIDTRGRVSSVWPIREAEITPPLPAFNKAIEDAIRQWEYEPLVVGKVKVPACMSVTVNLHWS